jgi:hypothetical protein
MNMSHPKSDADAIFDRILSPKIKRYSGGTLIICEKLSSNAVLDENFPSKVGCGWTENYWIRFRMEFRIEDAVSDFLFRMGKSCWFGSDGGSDRRCASLMHALLTKADREVHKYESRACTMFNDQGSNYPAPVQSHKDSGKIY